MSAKKHKRKAVKHHTHHKKQSPSLLSRYLRSFIVFGLLLITASISLLTVGYVSNAKVGLAMLSLFFGVGLMVFANFYLPKHWELNIGLFSSSNLKELCCALYTDTNVADNVKNNVVNTFIRNQKIQQIILGLWADQTNEIGTDFLKRLKQ